MRYDDLSGQQKLFYDAEEKCGTLNNVTLVNAEEHGLVIEAKYKNDPKAVWSYKGKNIWNFNTFEYRLKPLNKKPREFTIFMYKGKVPTTVEGHQLIDTDLPSNHIYVREIV